MGQKVSMNHGNLGRSGVHFFKLDAEKKGSSGVSHEKAPKDQGDETREKQCKMRKKPLWGGKLFLQLC